MSGVLFRAQAHVFGRSPSLAMRAVGLALDMASGFSQRSDPRGSERRHGPDGCHSPFIT